MKNVFFRKIINNKCDRKWRLAHVPREPARTRHPTGRTVSAPTKFKGKNDRLVSAFQKYMKISPQQPTCGHLKLNIPIDPTDVKWWIS